jgi:cellulose synthase/poly-beta-1,6-N-acetylglucosamine synthase-like glycosyltransferase
VTGPDPESLVNPVAEVARAIIAPLEVAALGYLVLINLVQSVLMVAAVLELRAQARRLWEEPREALLGSTAAPVITIVAPAYNEATTITESVRSLLTLRYPRLQVVVVNDGSPDATLGTLKERFDLVAIPAVFRRVVASAPVRGLYRSSSTPNLLVVDKENGGKADALNAGINVASGDLVCAIDADTIIEPDALLRVVRPFLGRDDVVATGGTIRVVNGSEVRTGRVLRPRVPRRFLAGVQTVEYLRAFLVGRLGWNRIGGNLIISGAFGLFSREAVLAVDGYLEETVGEDMELVVRLRRRGIETGGPSAVVFVPDPVAWTEAPESFAVLGRQRDRWHRGLADVIIRHRTLAGRVRYGALGIVVFPYFVVVELLGPVIEAVGVGGLLLGLGIGAVDLSFAGLFLAVSYGWGVLLGLAAVLLDEVAFPRHSSWRDRALMVLWALLENLGFRQCTVYWRLRGLVRYFRGSREWGAMARKGFSAGPG